MRTFFSHGRRWKGKRRWTSFLSWQWSQTHSHKPPFNRINAFMRADLWGHKYFPLGHSPPHPTPALPHWGLSLHISFRGDKKVQTIACTNGWAREQAIDPLCGAVCSGCDSSEKEPRWGSSMQTWRACGGIHYYRANQSKQEIVWRMAPYPRLQDKGLYTHRWVVGGVLEGMSRTSDYPKLQARSWNLMVSTDIRHVKF